MSSDTSTKGFRPPVADRTVRGGPGEPTQEQRLAERWRIMEGMGPAERLMETLRQLESDNAEPSEHLRLVDGLLIYSGPLGGVPENFLEAAREDRLQELIR